MKGKFKTFSNYHGILAEEDNTTIYGFENLSCERAGEIIIEKTGGAFGYINKGYFIFLCQIILRYVKLVKNINLLYGYKKNIIL